jgi:predicted ATPase
MKLSLVASLTLAMLAELAAAKRCVIRTEYCGHTLNKISTLPSKQSNYRVVHPR